MSIPLHLKALAEHAKLHRFERTLLVATTAGTGRQMLRALARTGGSWAGLDVTTLRPLALELARQSLGNDRLRVIDSFEEEARIDEALDRALSEPETSAFGEVAATAGFRRAVRNAIQALRLSGMDAARVSKTTFEDVARGRLLAATLRGLERELRGHREIDVAGVLGRAVSAVREGCPLPADELILLPGLSARGRAGELARALLDRGARMLPADPVGRQVPAGMLWPVRGGPAESEEGGRNAGGDGGRGADDRGTVVRRSNAHGGVAPPSSASGLEGLPLFAEAGGGEPDRLEADPQDVDRLEKDAAETGAPGTKRGGAEWAAPGPCLDPELQVEFFRAAGVHEELREVLRRVMQRSLPFDDVEIVTPDPLVYGPALQSLASRLGIDVTFAVGLPIERTLPGRVLAAWFDWIATGFPSSMLRRLLQSGDLRVPGRDDWGSRQLARTLRSLRIGWGRDRYLPLIDAALAHRTKTGPVARRHETVERAADRHAAELRDLEVLRRFVGALAPHLPDVAAPTSPSRLALGLRFVLELVPVESEVDRSARERLVRVLDRVGATLTRPASFDTALSTLRDHLAIRVPAPRVEGRAPWLADGGALHLTDLEHGGLSGRPGTFVVGMDAGRFPPSGSSQPMLLDHERRRIGQGLPPHRQLPLSEDRVQESRFRWEALLARLRGSVTISHAAWDAHEGRVQSPSPVLLDLLRGVGDSSRGYADLLEVAGPPVSRIPRGPGRADLEDLWLALLPSEGGFRDALAPLRERFQGVDRGLTALQAPTTVEGGPSLGRLVPRTALDPTVAAPTRATGADGSPPSAEPGTPPRPALSPTALQDLGACPLRYLYKRVLRIHPPDDPEFDPDQWLSAADRGALLHTVFERTVVACRDAAVGFGSSAATELALEILEEAAARLHVELPPPSEALHRGERSGLRRDVESFCAMLADSGIAPGDVISLEHDFGFDEAVTLTLSDGSLLGIKGRVDRVDQVEGGLRVIDYKTGKSDWMDTPDLYQGGRRLQHMIYAAGIDADPTLPGKVAQVAYHFPTVRGENAELSYPADAFEEGPALLTRLIEQIRAGAFIPTEDVGDCRFCDYAPICRYRPSDWGEGSNPRVAWTRDRLEEGAEVVELLRRVRSFEEAQ